jgi:hypothetical protein
MASSTRLRVSGGLLAHTALAVATLLLMRRAYALEARRRRVRQQRPQGVNVGINVGISVDAYVDALLANALPARTAFKGAQHVRVPAVDARVAGQRLPGAA